MLVSTEAMTVAAALDADADTTRWSSGHYTIRHEPSGAVLWIASGRSFVNLDPASSLHGSFGIVDKFIVWAAYRRWTARRTAQILLTE